MRSVTCFAIGAHSRSGWFPSRKAVLLPCVSLMKRFIAVKNTVMDSLSLSMKSSALPMAMNSSSRTRSGMKFFRIHSCTLSSSCASMYSWPPTSIGTSGAPVRSFSHHVSILSLDRMAYPMLNGAGSPLGK